ncbi:prohibitin family protein [Candidatus Woesearchaeota archaeon]|nr:prohibitin family protein [Candidatus Woesearchaeota archaeon]
MKLLKLTGLAALLAASMAFSGCSSTGSNEVGVRTKKWFGKGVEQMVYEPGQTYFFMPIINDWTTFDTATKTISMAAMDQTKGGTPKEYGNNHALPLKTNEGNDIWVALTVSYKINPAKAPFILEYVAGSDEEIRELVVMNAIRSITRKVLGELPSESFYDSAKRNEYTGIVKTEMEKFLNPLGILVEGVSVTNYQFNNEAYREAIEARRIAPQDMRRETDRIATAKNQGERELATAQGQYNTIIAQANGESQKIHQIADAEYFARQQDAAAKLKEAEAVAAGNTKLREALSGEGGLTQIKLRYYEIMTEGHRVIIGMPNGGGMNLRSTDINQLLEVSGLKSMVAQEQQENNHNNTPATSGNTNTGR